MLLLLASFALFGFAGVAIWAIQMAWIPFWAAGVVNGLGHWWGYRNFETTDTATNLTPWGVWIGGEELHNNHHAFPSSAKFALRKWEIDIGWGVIKGLEKLRLAKVLRVAPALDVRPNIHVPDTDTLKALLAHRFHAMTDYQRNVLKPALREEARAAGEKLRALLPRKMRKGLVDDGRWLKPDAREQLQRWVSQRPRIRTLVEYRQRLSAVLEARTSNASDALHNLQAWCREAEASGIRALQDYAARLKGYSLQPARLRRRAFPYDAATMNAPRARWKRPATGRPGSSGSRPASFQRLRPAAMLWPSSPRQVTQTGDYLARWMPTAMAGSRWPNTSTGWATPSNGWTATAMAC